MKITIFTGNQSRHLHLIKSLSKIADEVYCISESNTIFPGKVDDFFKKSKLMQSFFEEVIEAERKIFGNIEFLDNKAKKLIVKQGDLNLLPFHILEEALKSDIYIVFGASYIKGWLADFLINQNTYNIHMGISPYYRGASCNFWALYDNNPSYVGATIHKLSKGLDNGDIIFHATPNLFESDNSFLYSMRAVQSAHECLVRNIVNKKIFSFEPVKQDKTLQIRYSRNIDFNDEVVNDFFLKKVVLTNMKLKKINLVRNNA
jgi:folate-dependent phosphoribosylglycinamide formyltransferase PurN